jgi:hypothetical protein
LVNSDDVDAARNDPDALQVMSSTPLDEITADQVDSVIGRIISRAAGTVVVLASFQSAI